MRTLLLSVLCLFASYVAFAQHQNELVIQGDFYVQKGAEVHVLGDLEITGAQGKLESSGTITIHGHFHKEDQSQALFTLTATDSAKVIFNDDYVNTGEDQHIKGAFIEENALPNVILNKDGGYLKIVQNDVEIKGELVLESGILRTNTEYEQEDFKLIISNSSEKAISSPSASSNETTAYIQGALQRNIIEGGVYTFPVGNENYSTPATVKTINVPGQGFVIVRYYDDPITPIYQEKNCDFATPPDDLYQADGTEDYVITDCRTGRWNIQSSDPENVIFDLTILPDPDEWAACLPIRNFIGFNGETDFCPADDFNYYSGTAGDYDIVSFAKIEGIGELPVELVSFKAIAEKESNVLLWTTASEIENEGFEVLRSLDGENFESIGFVEGNGTTTDTKNYRFEDPNFQFEQIYYQLKQIDFDGTENFSNIVVLNRSLWAEFELYPNPIKEDDKLFIRKPSEVQDYSIEIYNRTGVKINSFENVSDTVLPIDMNTLQLGIYHIVIRMGNEFKTYNIIKN